MLKRITFGISLALPLFFFVFSTKAFATEYYVAGDTGLDTNAGSSSLPWKTIQKAADIMVAGDTVNVKGNLTYAETVTPLISGSANEGYITYQGWNGTGIPTIDAVGKNHGFYINNIGYIKISGFIIKNSSQIGIGVISFYTNLHTVIENNICINNKIGIYNGNSDGNKFYNNVLYKNTLAGFHSDGNYQITIVLKNNIAINNGLDQNSIGGLSVSLGINVISNNNNSWNNSISNYTHITLGDNDLSQDPKFINAIDGDFRLAANSALINYGATVSEVAKDIIGVLRPQGFGYDIGAYEFDGIQSEQVNIEPLPQNPVRASNLTLLSHIDGESAGDQFSLNSGGPNMQIVDINDDGYDDLIAGARYHYSNGVDYGGIYVFNGKTNFGDVNGTYADTIIRESVYGAFGNLNIVDDVTGDGQPELISSHYRYGYDHTGVIYIFNKNILTSGFGLSSSAIATITGPYANSRFGVSGTVMGDINGDGYKDYVFGGALVNKAYVFYGEHIPSSKNANSASIIYTNDINSNSLSFVKSQFDINHDGYKEIGVICDTCGTNGNLYIFKGGLNLSSKNLSQADIIISGVDGKSVGNEIIAGDINGDGVDDLVVSSSGGLLLFNGKTDFTSTTTFLSDMTISISDQDEGVHSVQSLAIADINNDSCPDLLVSNSIPRIYVLYGCSYLSNSGLSSPNLIYVGSGDMSYWVGQSLETGDINGDGYKEIFAGDPIYQSGNYTGRIYVLGVPRGTPVVNLNNIGKTNNLTITGSVTDTLTVGGVEVSTDNGSWDTCTVSSSNFSCNLPSTLSDGSHSLRLRSKNSFGVYMASREYASASFTYDRTTPKTDWTDVSGNNKKYESKGGDNVFTTNTLPTFTFSKSSDATTDLSRYEIIVDAKTYITNIDPNKPSDKDYREDDDKYIQYDGDNISVHAKKDSDKFTSGKAYKWKVRVIDNAGNSTDTDEKILRINTLEANFSNSFFPLSLLSVGGRAAGISSLNLNTISKSIFVNTKTPTFFGIAPVGTTVTLNIEKQNPKNNTREQVFYGTTTSNTSSRFDIKPTISLSGNTYFVNLSAVNLQGDYVEIPEFKIIVDQTTNTTLGLNTLNTLSNTLGNTQPSTLKDNEIIPSPSLPTPSATSVPLVKATTQSKHCFLWFCW